MTYAPDRLEQKVMAERDASGHFVTLARGQVDQLLALLKEQRAEIERLEADNERLRNEVLTVG